MSRFLIAHDNPQIPLFNAVKHNPLSYSTESRFSFAVVFFFSFVACFFSSGRGQFSNNVIMIQQALRYSFVFLCIILFTCI